MTILDNIIAHKRNEVAELRKKTSLKDLEKSKLFTAGTRSLSAFISDPCRTGIIAEFKRMSPSKGVINSRASVAEVTAGYSEAMASGLSVLTDLRFFGGNCEDLTITRELNAIPVLRKDFIIDEIQVVESKSAGADAVLLISSVLEKKQLLNLARLARSLRMEVLLEVHSLPDLELANEFVNIIGVNNRDLKTFSVNTAVSTELAEKIPAQFLKISESGITSAAVVKNLRKSGYDGFLIGELFMKGEDPAKAFSDFVKEIL